MLSIEKCPPPENTFLEKYLMNGNYVDCYVTTVDKQIPFGEFIFAFYTTWLFKTERLILKLFVNKPSTDAQVRQLSNSEINYFAAWTVEVRAENELLMCDFLGRTRSWFRVEHAGAKTKLYFGSAVVPKKRGGKLGVDVRALIGFHQLYSILLLYSAKQKLIQYQGVSS